jgi:ribosomal protein L35AE/L33A
MIGHIVSFRRSRSRQNCKHMIIQIDGVDSKDKAMSTVGKVVVWKSPANKELSGKIAAAHGSKGAVRAIFTSGMPGQSLAGTVEVRE